MAAATYGLAYTLAGVPVDHGGGGVVHEHHHRRRSTHLRQAPDHVDGVRQSAAATKGLGDGETEYASLAKGVDAPSGKGPVGVDRAGVRADDIVKDTLKRVVICGQVHPFMSRSDQARAPRRATMR